MKKGITLVLTALICLGSLPSLLAQKPERLNSAEIYQAIEKLNVLGSALYVAAHPDDENTRMISWLVNERHMHTAYLSLTRGDGGQNLVGPEIESLLGLIRTQELAAARRIDGGNQLFSRANDFGFSKHPDETFNIWGKDEVLADVVWAIRKWKPDIIINRFDHNSAGKTHGHHTASAMLAHEAFELAADPEAYPEQLTEVDPWQSTRLFFNTSWWFYGSQEAFDKADKSGMAKIDGGVYFPHRGVSNGEIAAESRSMHKSQGFGSVGNRGAQFEYINLLKGEKLKDPSDPFAGINTTWTRVEGGAPIGELLERIIKEYRHQDPAASVPLLMTAYKMIQALPDGYWKSVKSKEIERLVTACMGLFLEATADDFTASPGDAVTLTLEAINRSAVPCTLQSVTYLPMGADSVLNLGLADNTGFSWKKKVTLPPNTPYTNAYWLNEPQTKGMYTVKEQALRGLPETPRSCKVIFRMAIENQILALEREVVYKRDDDVKGEVYQPFEVVPPVFVQLTKDAYLFSDLTPQEVAVVVKAGANNVSGQLILAHPGRWDAEPRSVDFKLERKGEEQTFTFTLYPTEKSKSGVISPMANVNGQPHYKKLVKINYDHIPTQMVMMSSEAKVIRVDLKQEGTRLAYIMGAGDKVPESLRQIGYAVDLLEDKDIALDNLRQYDAVILGVRAYNTVERLRFHQPVLLEYVKQGGNMIVQYNTNGSLVLPVDQLAPYKLKLSRDRVTVEDAPVSFLAPDHEVLNFPNRISSADFDGWVQERGLYFPSEWGEEFTPILSCGDPGEPAGSGSLLVAKYGEGHYVYTGLSFFRELPAGVPGAYRLFANLIALGKNKQ